MTQSVDTLKQKNAQMSVLQKTIKRRAKAAARTGHPEPLHRTNWQIHWTWTDILEAQKVVGWSPSGICQYLSKKKPEWYATITGQVGGLHKGTVARWITQDDDGTFHWTPEVLQRAEHGRVGVTRRSKILVRKAYIFTLNYLTLAFPIGGTSEYYFCDQCATGRNPPNRWKHSAPSCECSHARSHIA